MADLRPNSTVRLRKGMDAGTLADSISNHLKYTLAKNRHTASPNDRFLAVAYAVRDRLVERWMRTQDWYYHRDVKRVYYLSMEFLMGRSLGNSLLNLTLEQSCEKALRSLGISLDDIAELEADAGLGNGGLGRLAACFLDSLATLSYPAYGYGLRYDYGIFHQRVADGFQHEEPDPWLRLGNPWEIARPENTIRVKFFGRSDGWTDEQGRRRFRWVDTHDVLAMPYDTPVPGYGTDTVNTLRLWRARAVEEFDLKEFNVGEYVGAVQSSVLSENITRVLYPRDEAQGGKQLRLQQEYLLVSAALQDAIRRYKKTHDDLRGFGEKNAVQMNDTHPALAIPEMMRLFLDEEGLDWDPAWEATRQVFGYTNHTLMPEALEQWSVDLLGRLLPRHLEIIYEINRRFLLDVAHRFPGDFDRLRRMSLIAEDSERKVRMANLAVVGSHSVNGVAALHTELLKKNVLPDFAEMYPGRFNNKTNGITPRRWLSLSNPDLADLISLVIGKGWKRDLTDLRGLRAHAKDPRFRTRWGEVKRRNKERLAASVRRTLGLSLNPEALFDVQVKRIHEYKRQHLNVLHVIALRNALRDGRLGDVPPRVVLLAGKAAPGYALAKLLIRLAAGVAEVVNRDPAMKGRLQMAFLPDYRVSLAERIIPAADLSQQISTAGKEASGTGNMKFALNGAVTIGTLDGANIEIREEVGSSNFFLFGLTAEQVTEERRRGYDPKACAASQPDLQRALDQIAAGEFSDGDRDLFKPLLDSLYSRDEYMLFRD
ncbi:MAG: glycogen/starch/alpha-glucan phosphorylase, partial [Planctomycetes bacterium]|nr:glycogen/starch/alpha-glucan phosphorylase [Planctomycetota bacterium]